jgi:hypothetical protein
MAQTLEVVAETIKVRSKDVDVMQFSNKHGDEGSILVRAGLRRRIDNAEGMSADSNRGSVVAIAIEFRSITALMLKPFSHFEEDLS